MLKVDNILTREAKWLLLSLGKCFKNNNVNRQNQCKNLNSNNKKCLFTAKSN
jgi:hypothetical protein